MIKAEACRAQFDLLAHHPIHQRGWRARPFNPGDASSPDLGRIVCVLRAADPAGTVLPVSASALGDGDLVVQQSAELRGRPRGLGRHAGSSRRFTSRGRMAPNVAINLLIRDSTTAARGFTRASFLANGQLEHSYAAFRFRFVAERIGKRRGLRAWGKAPAGL